MAEHLKEMSAGLETYQHIVLLPTCTKMVTVSLRLENSTVP
jgi:hypothetical protein